MAYVQDVMTHAKHAIRLHHLGVSNVTLVRTILDTNYSASQIAPMEYV